MDVCAEFGTVVLSPGQVTFTLDSIQMSDERLYICRLEPERLDVASVYDTVQFLVLGKYPNMKTPLLGLATNA